jgi:G:T-mismatch repair DNA endonuclease (very short patch repair protein)/endogenous inhibitor of DNA gyrase (YacG/DUF329 family)
MIQRTCEQCGDSFETKKNGKMTRRFCSVRCRNIRNARQKPARLGVHCPECGHWGIRQTALCKACGGKTPAKRRTWNAERDAYLRAHYADEGAEACGAALGLAANRVRIRANRLGLNVTPEAAARLIHEKAREYMTASNPMWRPDVRQKVRDWQAAHPEEVAAIAAALTAGHARIEREKPSKLEERLRQFLTELGVAFEASVIVKAHFVVDVRIGQLIIQADGDYWHGHPRFEQLTDRQRAQQKRDRAQDAYLQACGYAVLRIWESDLTRERLAALLERQGILVNR